MVELPAATQVRMCCSKVLVFLNGKVQGTRRCAESLQTYSILKILFIFLRLQFLFVCHVPKYLNSLDLHGIYCHFLSLFCLS